MKKAAKKLDIKQLPRKIGDFIKANLFLCILIAVTFTAILTTGIIFNNTLGDYLRMTPLFISLIVMLLQAKVNRYAYLLGGINSILYAVSYFTMGIREGALSALLMSFPLQVITFIMWQKKTKGNVTKLRRLNVWVIIGIIVTFALSWTVMFFWFPHDETASMFTIIVDTSTTLLGFITTVLTLLRFREYIVTQILAAPLTLAMYIEHMARGDASRITYVIYSVYTIICLVMALVRIKKQTSKK